MILWRIQSLYLNFARLIGTAIILVGLSSNCISLNGFESKSLKPGLIKSIHPPGFIITNSHLCDNLYPYPKLFIGIPSAPNHTISRQTIRQTWKRCTNALNVAMGFFIGNTKNHSILSAINEESLKYGDIIQGRFDDSYNNLTLKTLSLLEWVDDYCSKVHHVLKADDDVFINVHKLVNFIEMHWGNKRTIFGHVAHAQSPIRDRLSKFYLSYEDFPENVFPDFANGYAYIMTSDIVRDLYHHTMNHTFLKIEDVLVTGIVAKSLNITLLHNNLFSLDEIYIKVRGSMGNEVIEASDILKIIGVHNMRFHDYHILYDTIHRNPEYMITHVVL